MTKAEDLLDQKNISYKVTVEKESVFMTTVLPMLLICVIFMVFFTMGSRQATGGNARMMNFGKSRATLTKLRLKMLPVFRKKKKICRRLSIS